MAKIEQPVPGLFFDDLSKIRVLESESAAQTSDLKEECQDFIDSKLLNPAIVVCACGIHGSSAPRAWLHTSASYSTSASVPSTLTTALTYFRLFIYVTVIVKAETKSWAFSFYRNR